MNDIFDRHSALKATWEWIDHLDRCRWVGRGGASERAVAEALGIWAVRRGGIRFCASLDEVAIEAGLHRSNARRALRVLEEKGFVRKVKSPGPRTATVWCLRIPPPIDDSTPDASSPTGHGGFGALGEDWARWGAAGKSAALVWRACVAGSTVPELADRLQLTERSIRRHVRRLEGLGALERRDGSLVAKDPSGIADLFGSNGTRAAQERALAERRARRDLGLG